MLTQNIPASTFSVNVQNCRFSAKKPSTLAAPLFAYAMTNRWTGSLNRDIRVGVHAGKHLLLLVLSLATTGTLAQMTRRQGDGRGGSAPV